MYEVKLPQVSVSTRYNNNDALSHCHPYVVRIYSVTLHQHTHVCLRLPVLLYLIRYMNIKVIYHIYIWPQTLYV